MVHRGQGKVRQTRQEEASPTPGAVPKDEDNHSVPECQPEIVEAKQDNVRPVVREEQFEVSPSEVRFDGFTVTSGSYWYNRIYKSIMQYQYHPENGWVWKMFMIGVDEYYKPVGKIIEGWRGIREAIRKGELIPVSPEKVTLTILTGTNHCAPIEDTPCN